MKRFRLFLLAIMIAIVCVETANAQKDYSNHVRLDSIVYPIYPYGPAGYKYEYHYDEDGNQVGYVECLRNRNFLRINYNLNVSDNGDILAYNLEAVDASNVHEPRQYGYSKYNTEGKLIEAYEESGSSTFGTTIRSFDNFGRPTSFSHEHSEHKELQSFKYHENGRILDYSNLICDVNDEFKYTFNPTGQLLSYSESSYYKEENYNLSILWERETTLYYDSDHKLIKSESRVKKTPERDDEDFINSLTRYDEDGNVVESGRKVYKREYNVWIETESIEYTTSVTLDEHELIIKRETTQSGRSNVLFSEEFSYDDNGNNISRTYNIKGYLISCIEEGYAYDENNRLTKETVKLDGECVYELDYWYDEAGQRNVREERKSKTMPEPSSIKEYDNRGNLTVETTTNFNQTDRYEYTYDANDNMTSVIRYHNGEFAEKIEYDTTVPSFKTGGTANIYGFWMYSNISSEIRQAKYSDSHLFYLFDQPFKVKSYQYFDQGEIREVQLYYSKFIDEESAIVNTTMEEDSRTEYYDLEGRKLAAPVNGITIVKKGGKIMKRLRK